LMIEALAQTAAVMVAVSQNLIDTGAMVYFMGVDKCKFRRKVGPGDAMELQIKTLRGGGKVWKFAGRAVVEGDLACECEFTAMLDLSGGPQA